MRENNFSKAKRFSRKRNVQDFSQSIIRRTPLEIGEELQLMMCDHLCGMEEDCAAFHVEASGHCVMVGNAFEFVAGSNVLWIKKNVEPVCKDNSHCIETGKHICDKGICVACIDNSHCLETGKQICDKGKCAEETVLLLLGNEPTDVEVGSLTCSQNIPDLNISRTRAATVFFDNQLLVCGGLETIVLFDCIKLGPVGTWTAGPAMKKRRSSHSLTAIGNKVVVIGGYNLQDKYLNSSEILVEGSWQYGPSLTIARTRHCAVAYSDQDVILLGGAVQGGYLNVVEIFNIESGMTTKLPDLGIERWDLTCTLYEGILYTAGGVGPDGSLDLAEMLDLRSDFSTWSSFPRPGSKVRDATMLVLGGRLLIFNNLWYPNQYFVYKSSDNTSFGIATDGAWSMDNHILSRKEGDAVVVPCSFRP